MSAKLANVNHGTERGYMALSVAEYDGTMTEGLILSGGSSDGIINSNFVSTLGVSGLITASGGLTMASSQVFTLGANGVDDILLAADGVSSADDELVSAGYIDARYAPVGIVGTVTSVAIGGNDGIDVDSGSPITSAGTIQLGLSNIANSKLANSSVSYGGVSVSLGASDATPAFDLSDATAYTGDSSLVTVGTVTAGTWNGTAIANAYLANSSVSYG